MKLFTMIFLSLFLGKSCGGQTKNDLKTAVLEYTANTRGFYQKITIQDQMVAVSKDRSGVKKGVATKISDADWKLRIEIALSFFCRILIFQRDRSIYSTSSL